MLVGTMWYVTNVNLGHNHNLSPGKARYFLCNKKLDPATKRKLDIDDKAGIRTNKIYKSLAVEAEGYENLTFGERESVAIILRTQYAFALAQELPQHFVTISIECGK
jgi:hypothetical protein